MGPEKIGMSTYDGEWQPGDLDPYIKQVKSLSDSQTDSQRPNIALSPQMIDIGGIYITREQAILLGFIE